MEVFIYPHLIKAVRLVNINKRGGSVFRRWVVAFFTGGWLRFTPLLKLVSEFESEAGFFAGENAFERIVARIFFMQCFAGIVITLGIKPRVY
ncbi:MAG: hypothetical protein D4R64_09265 [Porphyromonadaceae bacterium]|nr:MAG: hypothetical protein D4R64_09265 [Porphyromonadaceae bacterium]